MASLRDLGATAQKILAAYIAELEPLIEVPERRLVAAGNVAVWDGEQLVVNLQAILQGQPGAPFVQTYTPTAINLFAQYGVQLVRAVPVTAVDNGPFPTQVPSAEELSESGIAAMDDAGALTLATVAIHQAHTITGPGEGFVIDSVDTLGPEGGMAATRVALNISLT